MVKSHTLLGSPSEFVSVFNLLDPPPTTTKRRRAVRRKRRVERCTVGLVGLLGVHGRVVRTKQRLEKLTVG